MIITPSLGKDLIGKFDAHFLTFNIFSFLNSYLKLVCTALLLFPNLYFVLLKYNVSTHKYRKNFHCIFEKLFREQYLSSDDLTFLRTEREKERERERKRERAFFATQKVLC